MILKEEFDTEKEALDFIDKNLSSEFQRGFEYSRKGWEYELNNHRIFIKAANMFFFQKFFKSGRISTGVF